MNENNIKGYEKLTPTRQNLIDLALKYVNEGGTFWKQGWKNQGRPESAVTGKQYTGINAMTLYLTELLKEYKDNRWVTFNQMQERGWTFKTDEEGNSLGKGNAVSIEFYELRDKETKKAFDRSVLEGMTTLEKQEYMDENVYPLRKYYRVFNADLVDGIPAKEESILDEAEKSEKVEDFIDFWSDKEVPIFYGGDSAYYSPSNDEIHLPSRQAFTSQEQFYCTALHEIGHSTGHSTRLNRKIDNLFGSEDYAIEELRAQFASMFMEQDFGITVDDQSFRNNSAYIKSWKEVITNDPDVLFKAIVDAERIAKYVKQKEADKNKRIEHFAIKEIENDYGEKAYELYQIVDYGQVQRSIDYGFPSKDEVMQEIDKMSKLPFYEGAEFREVSLEVLQNIAKKEFQLKEVKEEQSEEYKKPSECVAMGVSAVAYVDMKEKGVDSLTRMSDREVVEKAKTIGGQTFEKLYNGEKVFESQIKDEKVLMYRISMYSNDPEQAVRVFKSSGQYREDKPNSYYLQLAEMAMKVFEKQKELTVASISKPPMKRHFGINAKS